MGVGEITIKMISDGGCTVRHKPVCEYPPPQFKSYLAYFKAFFRYNKGYLFSVLKTSYLRIYLHFNDRVYILHG